MPVVIKLTFTAGRYHATPWGRHVNEGATEWPPSPWRLLRALIAVWKRTCPSLSETQVQSILTALVHPPVFHLPAHRLAHTRHAMPMNVIARNYKASQAEKRSGRFQGDPTIILDAFVCVGRNDPLFIGWPDAQLSQDDRAGLARLLAHLTWLGRAEAWVQAELVEQVPAWNCMPAAPADPNSVPVFCLDPATAFECEHYPLPPSQDTSPRETKPVDFLFDCPRWHLCLDTQTLHAAQWQTVPGARWVNFTLPPETHLGFVPAPPVHSTMPTVIRFLLDGPALPLLTDTVGVAEAFRSAAMGRFGRWCTKQAPATVQRFRRQEQPDRYWSPVLAGKDAAGHCRTGHEHAYYLPTAETPELRRVTHVTIYAAERFGREEIAALAGLRTVRTGDLELECPLVGLGQPSDFPQLFGGTEGASTWVSATPYVGPAHIGRSGRQRYLRKALRREIRRWIELHHPAPSGPIDVDVEELQEDDPAWAGRPRPFDFRRYRSRTADDDLYRPLGIFRVRFSRPLPGPLCVGYASHFGMGYFVPAALEDDR